MFDLYYLILVVPTLILSLIAQIMVKSTFARYSRIGSRRNISGADAARILMQSNNIRDVRIEQVAGSLTDHYNPGTKTLALSQPVFGETSIAAIGVAAHETGHAIQHATSYGPLGLRSTLVPVANIGSSVGPYIAIAGLIFNMPLILNLGIVLFAGAVLFYLITLPVEFNASRRALALLNSNAILTDEELSGARKVLTAAAMTYVASALTAVASLLRLVLLSRDNRD
jgi:Zn-dependent membrane protease YugP